MAGSLSRIWQKLFGARPASSPYDGIIHSVRGPNGHALAFAERSAVAQALQRIGRKSNDPNDLRRAVDEYTDLARRFASLYPDHQLVKHYTNAAKTIAAPDVHIGPETGHYNTVAGTGPVGVDLAHAATPLVRFLNRLRHEATGEPLLNVDRQPIESPAARTPEPPVRPSVDTVEQPSDRGDDVPVLRPAPVSSSTHKPIPLVGEPAANRWRDLDTLHASGADRKAMLAHLQSVHGTTRTQASDTIRRWANAKRVKS